MPYCNSLSSLGVSGVRIHEIDEPVSRRVAISMNPLPFKPAGAHEALFLLHFALQWDHEFASSPLGCFPLNSIWLSNPSDTCALRLRH